MIPRDETSLATDYAPMSSSLDEPSLLPPGPAHRETSPGPVETVLRDWPGETPGPGPGVAPPSGIGREGREAETVARPAPTRAGSGGSSREAPTVARVVVDLRSAAASYLRARSSSIDGLAGDWEPEEGGRSDSQQLFCDLHRSSPEDAEQLARGLTSMPEVGDEFLGFRLVEELGRGAFGRVFLAQQGDLADRLVALKITSEPGGESETLAQLQHTNIVPIFSVHHSPPFHSVCMPYFGRATLADLLSDVERQESLPDSGKALISTLAARRSSVRHGSRRSSKSAHRSGRGVAGSTAGPVPDAEPAETPSEEAEAPESDLLRSIASLSYVQAVIWIGARIADGLAHAHKRGILHRDLKPANVLMTEDGQPMILDFNLSEDTKRDSDASTASVGGTLPYMSPEHLERFLGGPVEPDERSDVFALGVMLFELLTGHHPYPVCAGHSIVAIRKSIEARKAGPAEARRLNPAITPAVESIVRHCLEADQARRYRSAADLHQDLERHLADLPLRHAPDRSPRERAAKWARRHPRLGSTTTVAIVAVLLMAGLASAAVARGRRLARLEASQGLARFRDEAISVRFLLNNRVDDRVRRARGEAAARDALGRYRVLDDPDWARRPAVLGLPPEDRVRLREDVAEVLLMLTQAMALDAAAIDEGPGRRDLARSARQVGLLAMANLPGGSEPRAFRAQQATLARLLGQDAEAARLAAEAEKIPLRTARDHYLAATGLALRGDHAKALPLAEEATRLAPQDFWSYFLLGVCQDRMQHHPEAMACFTTCIALRPDFAESWFSRGLSYLNREDLDRARADFDQAARLRPDWFEPPLNRAVAFAAMGEHRRAENDLTRALELGAPETRIYFLRAAAREAQGDRRGAELDRREGLKRQPTDVLSWLTRAKSKMTTDPQGALDDFQTALKLEPRSREALQESAYLYSNMPGREQDVLRLLDRAVELYPDFVPIRSGRGVELAMLGRREEALRDARESLWRDTSPAILYQVAGIYATTSKTHPEDKLEAYRLLGAALRAGFGFELLEIDHELDNLRNEPEFKALIDSARRQSREHLQRPPGR